MTTVLHRIAALIWPPSKSHVEGSEAVWHPHFPNDFVTLDDGSRVMCQWVQRRKRGSVWEYTMTVEDRADAGMGF